MFGYQKKIELLVNSPLIESTRAQGNRDLVVRVKVAALY